MADHLYPQDSWMHSNIEAETDGCYDSKNRFHWSTYNRPISRHDSPLPLSLSLTNSSSSLHNATTIRISSDRHHLNEQTLISPPSFPVGKEIETQGDSRRRARVLSYRSNVLSFPFLSFFFLSLTSRQREKRFAQRISAEISSSSGEIVNVFQPCSSRLSILLRLCNSAASVARKTSLFWVVWEKEGRL